MSARGGKFERMAVRLNAILRKVPKNRSLDGKTWHAETNARRALMRHLVKTVVWLIVEESEREHERECAIDKGRDPDIRPTKITIGGTVVDLSDFKPGDTIDIRVTDSSPVQRIPIVGDIEASKCRWCGDLLDDGASCGKSECIPF